MSTIELFDYQALHLAFSEEVVILSTMVPERFVKPTYHAVWSEWLGQLHGAIHAQMCACTAPHPARVRDAIQL